MKEALEKIIAAENKAKAELDKARRQADTILKEAQQKAKEIVASSAAEAEKKKLQLIEQAKKEAQKTKEDYLAKLQEEIAGFVGKNCENSAQYAQDLFNRIISFSL